MNSSGLQTRLAHTVYIFLCIYLWFPRWRQLVINFWLFAAVLAIKKCKRIFQRLLKQLRPVASKLGQESRFYRHLSVRLTSETNLLRSRGYARRAFQFVFLPSKPFFFLKIPLHSCYKEKNSQGTCFFPPWWIKTGFSSVNRLAALVPGWSRVKFTCELAFCQFPFGDLKNANIRHGTAKNKSKNTKKKNKNRKNKNKKTTTTARLNWERSRSLHDLIFAAGHPSSFPGVVNR